MAHAQNVRLIVSCAQVRELFCCLRERMPSSLLGRHKEGSPTINGINVKSVRNH